MSGAKGKPRQPLSVQLGLVGAITFLMVGMMLVGPLLLSIPPFEMFNIWGMLCDGISAAVGYILGFGLGRLIEKRRG